MKFDLKNRAFDFLRWVFCLPLSLFLSIVVLGLINIFYKLSCTFQIFAPYGICSSESCFLAEVMFAFVFLNSIYVLVPIFKDKVTGLISLSLGLTYLSVNLFGLNKYGRFLDEWENTVFIGIALIVFGVLLLKDRANAKIFYQFSKKNAGINKT